MPLPTQEDISKLAYETLVGRKNTNDIERHFVAVYEGLFKGTRLPQYKAAILLMQVAPIVIQKYLETHGNSAKRVITLTGLELQAMLEAKFNEGVKHEADRVRREREQDRDSDVVYTEKPTRAGSDTVRESASAFYRPGDCHSDGSNADVEPFSITRINEPFPSRADDSQDERKWVEPAVDSTRSTRQPWSQPFTDYEIETCRGIYLEDLAKGRETHPRTKFIAQTFNSKERESDEESHARPQHEKTDAGPVDSSSSATMQSVWWKVARAFGRR